MRILSRLSLLFFLCSGVGCGPQRPHLQTLQLNREGNSQLKNQNFQGAMDKYLEGLSYDPFAGELHMDLGLAFEGQQQADKAMQSYKTAEQFAEKDGNLELLFMSRFNQAQLLGKAKKVDEAITLYQKALEIIPSSNEVKTNIELLTQEQQGKGGADNKDQEQKDDQNQQNQKDQEQEQDKKEQDKKEQDKQFKQTPKYQPRPFQGKELTEGDVKKILGELKQQEEKIRAEYNRKEMKEQPRDKDW